jgi:hypothetical protein
MVEEMTTLADITPTDAFVQTLTKSMAVFEIQLQRSLSGNWGGLGAGHSWT